MVTCLDARYRADGDRAAVGPEGLAGVCGAVTGRNHIIFEGLAACFAV